MMLFTAKDTTDTTTSMYPITVVSAASVVVKEVFC